MLEKFWASISRHDRARLFKFREFSFSIDVRLFWCSTHHYTVYKHQNKLFAVYKGKKKLENHFFYLYHWSDVSSPDFSFTPYSRVPNKRWVSNKRPEWKIFENLLNVQDPMSVQGGIILKNSKVYPVIKSNHSHLFLNCRCSLTKYNLNVVS